MAIHTTWHDQDVIALRFERGWTWDDLRAAIKQADTMIISREHPVHLLIDIRQAGGLPRDFMRVAGELLSEGSARANEGHKVVIGAGRLIRAAYHGLRSVYPVDERPLLFAADTDEALRLLAETPLKAR